MGSNNEYLKKVKKSREKVLKLVHPSEADEFQKFLKKAETDDYIAYLCWKHGYHNAFRISKDNGMQISLTNFQEE